MANICSEIIEYIEVVNPSTATVDGTGDMLVLSEVNTNIPVIHPRYVAEDIANKKNDLINPNATGYTSTIAVYNALLCKSDVGVTITGYTNLGTGYTIGNGISNNKINLKSIIGGTGVSLLSTTDNIIFNINTTGTTGFVTIPEFNSLKNVTITGATNLSTGNTIYSGITDNKLTFKSIKQAGGIVITSDSDSITISGGTIANSLAEVTAVGAETTIESTFSGGLVVPMIRPNEDSVTAITINKTDGITPVISIDTISGFTGHGTITPLGLVHAYGNNPIQSGSFAEGTQTNAFIIDGSTDVDKDINWSDEGVPKWLAEIYRDENGKFWYLYNVESGNSPLTIDENGRIGQNKNTNILNYHTAQLVGDGINDIVVSGIYTQNYNTVYEIKISANGNPDKFQWRKSVDDGITYSAFSVDINCITSPFELEYGVFIQFENLTGHTVGDIFGFAAFTQLPQATYSIAPLGFQEVQRTEDYTANPVIYQDITALANGGNYENKFVVFKTGTTGTLQAFYWGTPVQTNGIYFNLDTVGESMYLITEYWDGNAWYALNSATHNYLDGTNSMNQSGRIVWSPNTMTNWTPNYLPDLVEEGYELYWLRIRTTTNPTKSPIAKSISVGNDKRLAIYSSFNDYKPSMFVDSLGRVSIGGGNITGKNLLQISKSFTIPPSTSFPSLVEIDSEDSSAVDLRIRLSSNDNISGGVNIGKSRGDLSSALNIQSGDSIGHYGFRGILNGLGFTTACIENIYYGDGNITKNSDLILYASDATNPIEGIRISAKGSGFGHIITPSARIHIQSGNTTIAPLKFVSGNLLNTPQAGAVEFRGNHWYGTTSGSTRKTFAFLENPIFSGNVSLPSGTTLNSVNLNDFILYSAATYNDLLTQKQEFDIYTGNTDTRINNISGDIDYISGVTDNKLNTSTFAIYTGSTIPWSKVSKSGSTLADIQTRNANDVNLSIPSWSSNNVNDISQKLSEYVEDTLITGRLEPVNVLGGKLTNTLIVSGGSGYINYEGFHKKIVWSGKTFNTSGYSEGNYYVYVDSNSQILISSSEPNNTQNIILGSFFWGGLIGVIQQNSCVIKSSVNEIVNSLTRQGIFIYDNGGKVGILGTDNLKIISSQNKIQFGLLSIQLPEITSNSATGYTFLNYFNSNDYGWAVNYYFNVVTQGRIIVDRWNDVTKNSYNQYTGFTFTFGSTVVTGTTNLSSSGLSNTFIYKVSDNDIYMTPVTSTSWNGSIFTINLATPYFGTSGTGNMAVNYAMPKLPVGKYAKHLIIRSTEGLMYLLLGQTYFDSENDAISGALPAIPSSVSEFAIKMAYIVTTSGMTTLSGKIYDIRPLPYQFREGGQSGGGTAITIHNELMGLDADDHLQYIRTDGTRNLTGIQKYNSHPTFTSNTDLVDKKYTDDADNLKLNISTFTGFTDITLPNNYYNKSQINNYTGTTVPNNYYNKVEINNYTGNTNNLINNKLNSSIFNNYTGVTAPATYASKSFVCTYTGTTVPSTYLSKSAFNIYSGTTVPNTYVNSSTYGNYTGATKIVIDGKAYLSGATFTGKVCVCKPAQNDNTNCVATTSWYISQGSTTNPLMNGNVSYGTSNLFSREDHIHPSDTTKLSTSIYTTYTGTTVPNTYLSKSAFNIYSGTTLPSNYYSKSQINFYTGTTAPNTYLGKSAFSTYSGTTVPTNYYNKSQINFYTGTTAPATYASKSFISTYTGTTVPNTYLSKSSFSTYSGTTVPANYYSKSQINFYTGTTAPATYASKSFVSTYTGTTAPNTYLSKSAFNTYSGTTVPNTYLSKSAFNTYSGTTVPSTYLSKSAFSAYSGTTVPNTYATKANAVTGATNLGTGTTIYTSVANNRIQLKSIKTSGSITINSDANTITIGGSGGSGSTSQTISATFVLGAGTPITTGNNKTNILYVPKSGTITKVLAYAKTAPTGADAIFDINKNGTSIWNSTQANRIKITAGNNSGSQTSFDTTALAAEDILTVDIDQIGSTIAGQDITLQVFITT